MPECARDRRVFPQDGAARGIRQAAPQHQAQHADRQTDEERQTPSPILDLGFPEGVDQGADGGAQEDAANTAEIDPGREQPPPAGRRLLHQVGDRGRAFAADRKPLQHTHGHDQNGGPDSNDGIVGQDADQEGGPRHHDDGEDQRAAAADAVAQMAE